MVFVHISPTWFFGYDIIFELIFAVVALSLGLFALRVSHLTSQRSANLFGKGFLLISISYFFQAIFNFLFLSQLGNQLFTPSDASVLLLFQTVGAVGHILFMLAGLVTLLYMTFEHRNKKLLFTLIALTIVPLLIVDDYFVLFYAISTICLTFIAWHYVGNYFKVKHVSSLVAALAFIFILIGHVQYFFSTGNPLLYVFGNGLELLGYLLILVNFYLVLKR